MIRQVLRKMRDDGAIVASSGDIIISSDYERIISGCDAHGIYRENLKKLI